MSSLPRRRLTIVIPIFDEEEILPELCRRLKAACEGIDDLDWSVLFVNNGSHDRSLELILAKHEEDPRFTALDLSRNFGHQSAITAGLADVRKGAAVIMDGDLQDPPEVIPDLVASWREGAEVVFAVRTGRRETGIRLLGMTLFHRFFQWISDFPIQAGTGVFTLVDEVALAELNRLQETHRFLPGLESWIGFDQRIVHYQREERAAGQPKQSLPKLVCYAFDAIFGFSFKPLRVLTWAGLMISGLGFLLALVFVVRRLIGIETAQTGFTTLITVALVLGGIQLLGIGILGEYLGRVYDETKSRPLFIVRRRIGCSGPEDD